MTENKDQMDDESGCVTDLGTLFAGEVVFLLLLIILSCSLCKYRRKVGTRNVVWDQRMSRRTLSARDLTINRDLVEVQAHQLRSNFRICAKCNRDIRTSLNYNDIDDQDEDINVLSPGLQFNHVIANDSGIKPFRESPV